MAEYAADVLADMGHNTGYNRSPVVPSYYEGNQMWILGNYLIEELRALGRTVKTTKKSRDDDPSVTDRGRMATGCKVAVSEHSNAGGLGKTDRPVGICVVDDACGPIDDLSLQLARRMAEVDKDVMGLKDAPQVYSRLSGKDRDGDGLKNDDYYGFLYGAHQVGVPAVIIENGFHDHGPTAKWLLDDGNLRKLAKAHAAEIDKFLQEYFDEEDEDMFTIPMKPGDKGEHVRQLQGILRIAGYYEGALDGSYGPQTTQAVTEFQAANGLEPDGKAGPETNAKLASFDVINKTKEVFIMTEPRYKSIDDVPEYARAFVGELVTLGHLKGTGTEAGLDLSEDMIRTMLIMDRRTKGLQREDIDAELGEIGDVIERPVEPPVSELPI